MPSTNAPVDQPVRTNSVQPLDMDGSMALFDQMESDLKRLRQDSDHLTASIQQLEIQRVDSFPGQYLSNDAWVLGVQGLLLGLGVLMAGALVAWLMPRWVPLRTQSKHADFLESALYLSSVEPITAPASKAARPSELPNNTPHWPAEQRVVPPADEKPAPAKAETPPTPDDSPVLEATQGFDFKAAASDVERVRKSLAEKRAQRWKQRHRPSTVSASLTSAYAVAPAQAGLLQPAYLAEATSTDAAWFKGLEQLTELNFEPEAAPIDTESIDLLLDFDFDSDNTLSEPEIQKISTPASHTLVPVVVSSTEVEPSLSNTTETTEVIDAALSVKLALAQEFHALGLIAQARELATEIITTGEPDMAAMASEVLSRIDLEQQEAEQQQQNYAALISSLREVDSKNLLD